VDLAAGALAIEGLKKRWTGIYRALPVSPALLDALDLVHGIRELQGHRGKGDGPACMALYDRRCRSDAVRRRPVDVLTFKVISSIPHFRAHDMIKH